MRGAGVNNIPLGVNTSGGLNVMYMKDNPSVKSVYDILNDTRNRMSNITLIL